MKTYPLFITCALKTFRISLLAVMVLVAGHAFVHADDFGDALKKAKGEDKAVVLYFFSQYCGYCTAMDKDVLADREVARTLKNDLVYLRIDAEKRADLARQYGIRGYPTTALLEPSGKSIIRVPGYLNKKEFALVIDYAKRKFYKSITLKDFLRKGGVDVE